MLDRSIHTREALVYSILINEVKDMFYRQCRHLFLGKNFEPCLWAQF
jgi:hypothetical protein